MACPQAVQPAPPSPSYSSSRFFSPLVLSSSPLRLYAVLSTIARAIAMTGLDLLAVRFMHGGIPSESIYQDLLINPNQPT